MDKEIRKKVYEKYNGNCAYCGNSLEYKNMQVDHIQAKRCGGKDELKNYNPSCKQCNFYKSTLTLESFRKKISTLEDRLKKIFIFRLALKYNIISLRPFYGKFYFEKFKK